MSDVLEEIGLLKLNLGLLEKDVHNVDRLCTKISESIEKMQEVNANLMKIITIHEQKHGHHDITESDLKSDIKELHARVTTVNKELQGRMDEFENAIFQKIDSLKDTLIEDIAAKKQPTSSNKDLDKYTWMVIGAALGFGWVIGNVNLTAIASIFK